MNSSKNSQFLIETGKFVLFLCFTLVLYNSFTFFLTKLLITRPNIIKFRLVCTISQILSSGILYVIFRPSFKDAGFNWINLSRKVKLFIIISTGILLLLVILSYFVMSAKRIFALVTNFHFGLITPIFEELIFRGYWWERLNKYSKNVFITLISTSILFGLFHFGYYFIVYYTAQIHTDTPPMMTIILTKVVTATILGFILGFIRIRLKDVSIPIILHGIFNIVGN